MLFLIIITITVLLDFTFAHTLKEMCQIKFYIIYTWNSKFSVCLQNMQFISNQKFAINDQNCRLFSGIFLKFMNQNQNTLQLIQTIPNFIWQHIITYSMLLLKCNISAI